MAASWPDLRNQVVPIPIPKKALVILLEFCDAGCLGSAIRNGAFREKIKGTYPGCLDLEAREAWGNSYLLASTAIGWRLGVRGSQPECGGVSVPICVHQMELEMQAVGKRGGDENLVSERRSGYSSPIPTTQKCTSSCSN